MINDRDYEKENKEKKKHSKNFLTIVNIILFIAVVGIGIVTYLIINSNKTDKKSIENLSDKKEVISSSSTSSVLDVNSSLYKSYLLNISKRDNAKTVTISGYTFYLGTDNCVYSLTSNTGNYVDVPRNK